MLALSAGFADAQDQAPEEQQELVQDIPEPQRPALLERSVETEQALSRQLRLAEQQILQGQEEPFLALWNPAHQAKARGLVIIVPGAQTSADWPQAIAPLRQQLPEAGWSTLSISLPDSPIPPLPAAILPRQEIEFESAAPIDDAEIDEQNEIAEENASLEEATAGAEQAEEAALEAQNASEPLLVTDPAPRIFARLDAAIAFAQAQNAENLILLGHLEGAYWASQYLAKRQPPGLSQLLVVSPRLPAGQAPELDELIPSLKLATGDVFFNHERPEARLRLNTSKQLGHPDYTQVMLQAIPADPYAEQTQLVRRVRGWLERGAKAR